MARPTPWCPFDSAREVAELLPDAVFVARPDLGHDLPAEVAVDLIHRLKAFHASNGARG